jgi:hypothetical protein
VPLGETRPGEPQGFAAWWERYPQYRRAQSLDVRKKAAEAFERLELSSEEHEALCAHTRRRAETEWKLKLGIIPQPFNFLEAYEREVLRPARKAARAKQQPNPSAIKQPAPAEVPTEPWPKEKQSRLPPRGITATAGELVASIVQQNPWGKTS